MESFPPWARRRRKTLGRSSSVVSAPVSATEKLCQGGMTCGRPPPTIDDHRRVVASVLQTASVRPEQSSSARTAFAHERCRRCSTRRRPWAARRRSAASSASAPRPQRPRRRRPCRRRARRSRWPPRRRRERATRRRPRLRQGGPSGSSPRDGDRWEEDEHREQQEPIRSTHGSTIADSAFACQPRDEFTRLLSCRAPARGVTLLDAHRGAVREDLGGAWVNRWRRSACR